MICPERSVLIGTPAELGHYDDHDAIAIAKQVGVQRCQSAAKRIDQVGLLAGHRPLKEMRVPSAQVNGSDLETYFGFDQSRDLSQSRPKIITRVSRASFGPVIRLSQLVHLLDQLQSLAGRRRHYSCARPIHLR